MMPAQYVKPYVKTDKSDYIDADAPFENTDGDRGTNYPSKARTNNAPGEIGASRRHWCAGSS
jgi:hypothetical protein